MRQPGDPAGGRQRQPDARAEPDRDQLIPGLSWRQRSHPSARSPWLRPWSRRGRAGRAGRWRALGREQHERDRAGLAGDVELGVEHERRSRLAGRLGKQLATIAPSRSVSSCGGHGSSSRPVIDAERLEVGGAEDVADLAERGVATSLPGSTPSISQSGARPPAGSAAAPAPRGRPQREATPVTVWLRRARGVDRLGERQGERAAARSARPRGRASARATSRRCPRQCSRAHAAHRAACRVRGQWRLLSA